MYEKKYKEINRIVDTMLESYEEHSDIIRIGQYSHIDKNAIYKTIDDIRRLFFPGFFDNGSMCEYTKEYYVRDTLVEIRHNLVKQTEMALRHADDQLTDDSVEKAKALVVQFMGKLVDVRTSLAEDVEAFFDGDPASTSKSEIILSYPGIYAIMIYRLAHELYELEVPMIPRIMSEYSHGKTGIDIHPGARIGKNFFIDHGTGIVIGETCIIGDNVKIYQGVTLGAHSTRGGRKLSGNKRHPNIEDNVTIYSGASILGGDTTIGEGSVIGSNAFITESVPGGSRVYR